MLVKTWDRMQEDKREKFREIATGFLEITSS
jgi:hypothetical protein